MKKIRILWTDDEIDLLRPHILFLEEKGYMVDTSNNGEDALEMVKKEHYDIIFLDENMPGRGGLEILPVIKSLYPTIPVVMITKSEAEDIMEAAIGSHIADFLIKPVNPNQILLSLKKNIDHKKLITKKTTADYQSDFGKLGMQINDSYCPQDWVETYKRLVHWELELEKSADSTMDEVLKMQKTEANSSFAKFIKKNYYSWFDGSSDDVPILSPSVFKNAVFPHLKNKEKVVVLLIDNLRYDQWRVLQPIIREDYTLEEESIFFAILPTATQYARNAMFAGLMPDSIEKLYPKLWLNDDEEGGKNLHEEELLRSQLSRNNLDPNFYYEKVLNNKVGKKIVDNINELDRYPLSVIVYNFIDMLSHSRTDMDMIRELAGDESAYRSLTLSWFKHSPLLDLLRGLSEKNVTVVITTDHGTIRVTNPIKVIGDRQTTTNLRYKQGRNLSYNPKEVFEIVNPEKAHLPKTNISTKYIFSTNENFFAYPNNYNYYVKYYKDTFQHGGISLEEMLVPLISLKPKK